VRPHIGADRRPGQARPYPTARRIPGRVAPGHSSAWIGGRRLTAGHRRRGWGRGNPSHHPRKRATWPAKASGCSISGRWPARAIGSKRAPGIMPA